MRLDPGATVIGVIGIEIVEVLSGGTNTFVELIVVVVIVVLLPRGEGPPVLVDTHWVPWLFQAKPFAHAIFPVFGTHDIPLKKDPIEHTPPFVYWQYPPALTYPP